VGGLLSAGGSPKRGVFLLSVRACVDTEAWDVSWCGMRVTGLGFLCALCM